MKMYPIRDLLDSRDPLVKNRLITFLSQHIYILTQVAFESNYKPKLTKPTEVPKESFMYLNPRSDPTAFH